MIKIKVYFLIVAVVFSSTLIITATKQVQTVQDDEEGVEELKSFDVQYSPYNRDKTEVRGLKLGLPMSAGQGIVHGAEISFLCSDTANISGFQGSLIGVNITKRLSGAQWALVANMLREQGNGAQFGILSFAAKSIKGAQFGLFCYSKKIEGLQLGIINDADDLADFQLGILNYNKHAWVPLLPVINFSPRIIKYFYEKEKNGADIEDEN